MGRHLSTPGMTPPPQKIAKQLWASLCSLTRPPATWGDKVHYSAPNIQYQYRYSMYSMYLLSRNSRGPSSSALRMRHLGFCFFFSTRHSRCFTNLGDTLPKQRQTLPHNIVYCCGDFCGLKVRKTLNIKLQATREVYAGAHVGRWWPSWQSQPPNPSLPLWSPRPLRSSRSSHYY